MALRLGDVVPDLHAQTTEVVPQPGVTVKR